ETRRADARAEEFTADFGPDRAFERASRVTAKAEVFEPALDQMLGAHASNGFGIGHHIDQPGNLRLAMPDDDSRQTAGQGFFHFFDVAKNNSVGLDLAQGGPGLFEAPRLPVERPGAMVMRVIGNPSQEGPA